jgi:two-component system, cell cycle sensor histidine kinase and response regulator CckA
MDDPTNSIHNDRVSFSRHLFRMLPFLVLGISLMVTSIMWHMIDDAFTQDTRRDFQEETEAVVSQLIERLHSHEEVLKGGGGLFNVAGDVTREQWREYVSSQQFNRILPGIMGVGYAAWLTPNEKESHIRMVRAEGFPEYRIKPENKRPVYSSIIYLEPFTWPNRLSFGYDMYSETNRRSAMNRARDEGAISLTSGIILVQETQLQKQYGFLMYLPVYRQRMPLSSRQQRRAALKGFVYSPIRMKDFVYGTLGRLPTDIAFEIFDGESTQSDKLRFSSFTSEKILLPANYESALTRVRTVELYGRNWTFSFKSLPSFEREFNRSTSLTVLIAGILTSLLLAGIVFILQTTRDKAIKLARGMTQELRESEEKVRLILYAAGEAIYGLDNAGCCTFANPACLRLLGYNSEDELLGKNMHCLVHHSHADGTTYPRETCSILNAIRTNTGCHLDTEVYWRSDGTSFPVEYWSFPQEKDGRVVGAVVSFLDVTERKQNETLFREQTAAIMQREKMASLGQLAAGVAHEINNPMGFVAINMGVMADYFDRLICHDRLLAEQCSELSPAAREIVEMSRTTQDIDFILSDGVELIAASQRGVGRMKKIVGDLKTFSRTKPEDKEPTDLNSCLESALSIASSELKYMATILKEYGQLPLLLCNPGQLNQVFLNLLMNAGEAILPPGEIVLKSWCDEQFVYVSISDNGEGIPEGIKARLFEPFFTTKAVGKGTGLGLSISYEIIKKHNGTIQVESTVGVGTTFTVILPRVQEDGA